MHNWTGSGAENKAQKLLLPSLCAHVSSDPGGQLWPGLSCSYSSGLVGNRYAWSHTGHNFPVVAHLYLCDTWLLLHNLWIL